MCSQSISGSSLLSGYDEDDIRETSGRSRREFDQIDAVLYGEEVVKRSSIKKISEEWSSKPHFRVRGRLVHIERQYNTPKIDVRGSTLSSFDILSSDIKLSSINFNESKLSLNDTVSGRSSIDSIEGSELTNGSDLDDDLDATNTSINEHFHDAVADSFDTDEDDDYEIDRHEENDGYSSRRSIEHRTKHPQLSIKCLKDSIVTSLAEMLLEQFFREQQTMIHTYTKNVFSRHSIKLRSKPRPTSLPPRSLLQNRLSLPASSIVQFGTLTTTSTPYRATPESNAQLNSLLRVTPLRTINVPFANIPSSPRKSQVVTPSERAATSLSVDKRSQQQQQQQQNISLVGTAVPTSSSQSVVSTPQTTQSSTRHTLSLNRYRSATTITSNTQSSESAVRLPPIPTERLITNEQTSINRPSAITAAIIETIPATVKSIGGINFTTNTSSTPKLRTLANGGKVLRTTRPITISSSKDLHSTLSTTPIRSITTSTPISQTALKITAAARSHPHQHQ